MYKFIDKPYSLPFVNFNLMLALFNRYTFGQPVPGKAWVEVCRDHWAYHKFITHPLCLVENIEVCNFGYCAMFKNTFLLSTFTLCNSCVCVPPLDEQNWLCLLYL